MAIVTPCWRAKAMDNYSAEFKCHTLLQRHSELFKNNLKDFSCDF